MKLYFNLNGKTIKNIIEDDLDNDAFLIFTDGTAACVSPHHGYDDEVDLEFTYPCLIEHIIKRLEVDLEVLRDKPIAFRNAAERELSEYRTEEYEAEAVKFEAEIVQKEGILEELKNA